MTTHTRIDLAVGQARAAELVKLYRDRLVEHDHLPADRALHLACQAYADGYVYVTAAPGQVWERKEKDGTGPDLLLILSFDQSQEGRTALCEYSDGEHDELLLDELRRHYALRCWPADDNTEPSGPCPGQH
ncbi:hypothetical protein ACFYM0_02720 [Streptomyces sp. NPDC006487]|uniref:hypothetical protein n=1 Tax=Streptomyces sp. NPDC006487 TaxID=3364748 RepID=UPI0036C94D42